MRAVEETKAGTYRVRFRHGGKQTSETFPNRKRAEQFVKWLDALGPQGALDRLYEAEQDATVPTLDQVAEDHIAHLTGIEHGTRLTYGRLWARTWSPRFGTLPANRLTADDVRRAVNALGEEYSRKSLENQRGLLAGVLGRAVELGYLAKNPAKGIRLPRGGEVDRTEMRVLTPDEYEDVLARIPVHYQPFVDFLAGTGCRWGEVVALTVGDVNLPAVRIRRALKWSPDNNRVVGPPKTAKGNRTVILPVPIIPDVRAACAGKAKGDLVFTAPRGGPILHRTFWSRVWLPAVSHLEPRPRIHDLRHSYASNQLAQGTPIHIVQSALGHEDIRTTVNTYGHLLPDAQAQAARAAAMMFQSRPEVLALES